MKLVITAAGIVTLAALVVWSWFALQILPPGSAPCPAVWRADCEAAANGR